MESGIEESVLTASHNALTTDLGDELVVIEGVSGKAYRYNGSARMIWLALPATKTALTSVLIDRFGITEPIAARDVELVLKSMLDAGLIESESSRVGSEFM